MRWAPDPAALADLAAFAHTEAAARDIDPWARTLRHVVDAGHLPTEEAHWVIAGYNTWDAFGQAFGVHQRWPTAQAWSQAPDAADAAVFPIGSRERRNLYGGKVLRRLDSTAAHLGHGGLQEWLHPTLTGDPAADWNALSVQTRLVWGVGRQAAFEWVETLQKCLGWPITAPDAALWESTGPAASLRRLYGETKPDRTWLDHAAHHAREHLAEQGIDLAWEDFETVICDFNVMRDGRYYPGKHLAALRAEIDDAPPQAREWLLDAWDAVVPAEWADTEPGVKKHLLVHYRDTGRLLDRPN